MATQGRREAASVARLLLEEPYCFEFSQAVRLLERLSAHQEQVGHDAPGREPVLFSVPQSFGFPASEVHDIRPDAGAAEYASPDGHARWDSPPVMTVAFFGLTGPLGILPSFYTAFLRQCLREGDRSTAEFFDLFNHRLISLFYRAGEKYRVARDVGTTPTVYTRSLFALIGLGGPMLRGRSGFDERLLLCWSGIFSRQVRSSEGLEGLLGHLCGLPTEVRQFVTRWATVEPDVRSRLGRSGMSNELGVNTLVGGRVRDAQGKFRLRIGPLSFAEFRSLLPGLPLFRLVVELTRLYVGLEFEFELELILRADEVPRTRLSALEGKLPVLRRFSWLTTGNTDVDVSVIFPAGD